MRRAIPLRLTHVLLVGAFVGVMLLTTACGGSSQLQQQASAAHAQLDTQLKHAQAIGVPASDLQTIQQQEQKLNSNSAPFSLFDDTPDNTFYTNQTSSYQALQSSLQVVTEQVTGADQGQAQQDLLSFQQTLTAQQAKKVGDTQAFAARYTSDKNLLAAAQTPNNYLAVSADANNAVSELGLMSTTYGQLVIFNSTINQMKQAHIDVTAIQSQYTTDLTTFNASTTTDSFQKLGTLINAQYQLAVVNSIQSLPYVGAAKLQEFQSQLNLLKTYGMDPTPYQKMYNADETAMNSATTISQYLKVSNKIDSDMSSMDDELVQGAAKYQITQLNNEAIAWGNAHAYHDPNDGKNYILDSGYTMAGIGYWLQQELGWAYAPSDYQSLVNEENNEFFDFQMMQQDYSDKTPYNQVHETDTEIMQHYPSLQHGVVLMVSMVEQAMRYYDNGKLIKSFLVTTGRVELPSLPGLWTPILRESPTVFKSTEPTSSPYYYPPTPIHEAIEYHGDGYFVHDSWWRNNYGPGTQFPHTDSSGNYSSSNGSHGCVNVEEDQAAWVYANTDWNTQIMIY